MEVGSIRFLLRLTISKEEDPINLLTKGRQEGVRVKLPRLRHSDTIIPSRILFLTTNVLTKSYQLTWLTYILRSLHLALKRPFKTV